MNLQDDISILQQVPLLALLDREALRLLTFAAEQRDLRTNEVLFHQGAPARGGYVVTRGEIETPFEIIEAVSLIGHNALFVDCVHAYDARARVSSRIIVLTPQLMKRVLTEFPHSAALMKERLQQDLLVKTMAFSQVGAVLSALDLSFNHGLSV